MRAKVPPATCFPHNTNAKRILRRSDTASTHTQEGKISRKKKKIPFRQISEFLVGPNVENGGAAPSDNLSADIGAAPPPAPPPSRVGLAPGGLAAAPNECNMVMMHSHSFQSPRKHNMPISSVLITARFQGGKVKGEYKQPQL